MGSASNVGGQEKEWMGCLVDDLRAFGINGDQWTTAAQDDETKAGKFLRNGLLQRKSGQDYGMQ